MSHFPIVLREPFQTMRAFERLHLFRVGDFMPLQHVVAEFEFRGEYLIAFIASVNTVLVDDPVINQTLVGHKSKTTRLAHNTEMHVHMLV